MRDHGGNIDAAIAEFGGTPSDWIDLSTGINPRPYPVPTLSTTAWSTLPTRSSMADLLASAKRAFNTNWGGTVCAGAQAGIQMLPRILPIGHAKILTPTYNEHAASLRASGWSVTEVTSIEDLSDADLAVVVNPNNPDGAMYESDDIANLA
ncbi:MAG: threonine-phosphate decarboxylase, partial [Paracoccaceae bacterium]|nr:threonine-phosphate decarboxylase [Paracoccaceae bacterium]